MLGHSEDYVSIFVPRFDAHCNSLSFVIISWPNHLNEAPLVKSTFCYILTDSYTLEYKSKDEYT